jgi:hypothetical protein
LRVSDDEPTTDELRRRQRHQELAERELAAAAVTDAESDSHQRRADKAAYLRGKLEEREQAEQRAARPDD